MARGMRIAWFVHGRGKGHSVRTLAALPAFADHEIHLFGGGEAARALRGRPELNVIEPCLPGPSVLRQFPRRVRADLARLAPLRPDVLVSDGDGPSVHAARLLRIPVIAMSHGLVFGHACLPRGLPKRALVRERVNAASASWCASRRIAVHFAPLAARTAGTLVARPDPRPGLTKRASDGSIVSYFRDEGGEAWLALAARTGRPVLHFGTLSREIPGVITRAPSVEGFAHALERAAGVIATAGNHLPAECAELGIPMLALHAARDAEQRMNGLLVEHAGLGVRGVLEAPSLAAFARYAALLGVPRGAASGASLTVTEALRASLGGLFPASAP